MKNHHDDHGRRMGRGCSGWYGTISPYHHHTTYGSHVMSAAAEVGWSHISFSLQLAENGRIRSRCRRSRVEKVHLDGRTHNNFISTQSNLSSRVFELSSPHITLPSAAARSTRALLFPVSSPHVKTDGISNEPPYQPRTATLRPDTV